MMEHIDVVLKWYKELIPSVSAMHGIKIAHFLPDIKPLQYVFLVCSAVLSTLSRNDRPTSST